jgi:hypothetical protein
MIILLIIVKNDSLLLNYMILFIDLHFINHKQLSANYFFLVFTKENYLTFNLRVFLDLIISFDSFFLQFYKLF